MQNGVFADAAEQIRAIRQMLENSLIRVAAVDGEQESDCTRCGSVECVPKSLDGEVRIGRQRALPFLLTMQTLLFLGGVLWQLASRRCVIEPHRDGP